MTDTKKPQDEFDRARQQLERAASDIDELTLARLRAGRKRAVAAAGARRGARAAWWMPLTTAVAATLIGVTIATQWWRAPEPATLAATDDIELLAVQEDPDFFENLYFYDWIENQRDAG